MPEKLILIRDIIESYSDGKVKHSFYFEFSRRFLVLQLVEEYCQKGSVIADFGAQPFIMSCALKLLSYTVIVYNCQTLFVKSLFIAPSKRQN